MNRYMQLLGRILFWIGWPGLWLLSRGVKRRTRVLVVCNNEVLLLKDWLGAGKWTLPGGGVKFGEDPLVCAKRELKEEAGIDIKKLTFFKEFPKLKQIGMNFHCLAYYIELKSKPALHLHPLEIAEAQWVSLDELANHDMNQAARMILEAFSQEPNLLH